ncbi:hermansky-pudlak syndrome protein [Anaeramoeba ignava]|uniref:Hermansky-pudlak syndrome protein n=1 Tax=Anaeramoeba ignava TaxID=1746090 RepID=A0A9Q0REX3_ANAIG|nr:hermansky-pudlak syndrome protein [Anaeramoeba ignava]
MSNEKIESKVAIETRKTKRFVISNEVGLPIFFEPLEIQFINKKNWDINKIRYDAIPLSFIFGNQTMLENIKDRIHSIHSSDLTMVTKMDPFNAMTFFVFSSQNDSVLFLNHQLVMLQKLLLFRFGEGFFIDLAQTPGFLGDEQKKKISEMIIPFQKLFESEFPFKLHCLESIPNQNLTNSVQFELKSILFQLNFVIQAFVFSSRKIVGVFQSSDYSNVLIKTSDLIHLIIYLESQFKSPQNSNFSSDENAKKSKKKNNWDLISDSEKLTEITTDILETLHFDLKQVTPIGVYSAKLTESLYFSLLVDMSEITEQENNILFFRAISQQLKYQLRHYLNIFPVTELKMSSYYIKEFPGLVHFMLVNRTKNRILKPKISKFSFQENQVKKILLTKNQIQQHFIHVIKEAQVHLFEGCLEFVKNHGDLFYSHSIWFENQNGEIIPKIPKLEFNQKKNLSLPEIYRKIMKNIPDEKNMVCYEIYSLYYGLSSTSMVAHLNSLLTKKLKSVFY